MPRIKIPVAELEFERSGQTLWVHGPDGGTVLRIKCTGQIVVSLCQNSPTAHSDLMVQGDVSICVPAKAKKGKG